MPAKKNTLKTDRFVAILAGGRGERFWPLSRQATPKQLLSLFDKKSFLQNTVERVKSVVPLKNIFIITNESQAAAIRKQLPKLTKDNVVAEPCGRNTCPAVALAAAMVGARSTTATMAILPSDHVIPPKSEKKFQRILEESLGLAGRGQAIVTIGIKPTGPETGYGYIQMGDKLPPPKERKAYKTAFHVAQRFVEKPEFDRALEYVNDGGYRWNAGMFVFSYATIDNALKDHNKELHGAFYRWANVGNDPKKLKVALKKDYPNLRNISFDYGIMEKAEDVIVADGDFEWDDLGALPAMARHLPRDGEGNAADADYVHVDSAHNVIFDTRAKKQRTPITLVGLRDHVVVLTDDTTLIAHKRATHKMRDLVAKLAESKAHQHLV